MVTNKPSGLIDTLSAGFGAINKKLLIVIAIPAILDLLLWFGPRISAAPLVSQGLNWYNDQLVAVAPDQEERGKLFSDTKAMVEPLGKQNLVGLLAWQTPSLLGAGNPLARAGSGTRELSRWGMFIPVAIMLAALGVLLAAIYLGALAQLVRGTEFDPRFFMGRIGLNWGRLLSYLLLVGVVVGVLSGALLFIIAFVGGLGPQATSILSGAGLALALFLLLHIFFVDDAIFVGDVGPFKAIWQSINIVSRNFWPTFGLFAVINVIGIGIRLALTPILTGTPGVMAAILINAYISSGLVAAGMVYYRDRYAIWQEALKLETVPQKQRI